MKILQYSGNNLISFKVIILFIYLLRILLQTYDMETQYDPMLGAMLQNGIDGYLDIMMSFLYRRFYIQYNYLVHF